MPDKATYDLIERMEALRREVRRLQASAHRRIRLRAFEEAARVAKITEMPPSDPPVTGREISDQILAHAERNPDG